MVSSFAIRTAARFPDENFTVSSYLPSYGHNSVVRGCLCRMRWDSVPASENTARTLIALGGLLVHPIEPKAVPRDAGSISDARQSFIGGR